MNHPTKFLTLFAVLNLFSVSSYCQQGNNPPTLEASEWNHYSYKKLKEEVTKEIVLEANYLSDSTFGDIDSMAKITALKATKLLTFRESKDSASNAPLQCSAMYNGDRKIRVYNFSYPSGGTRDDVGLPVIQWNDRKGHFHAYNFSVLTSCSFYNIHKLKTDNGTELYLLIGDEKGNSTHILNTAYVIGFKDDELVANYPAFVNRPVIILENSELSFNDTTQIFKAASDEVDEDNLIYMKYGSNYEADDSASELLFKMFDHESYAGGCELKFNGKQFTDRNKFIDEETKIKNQVKDLRERLQRFVKDTSRNKNLDDAVDFTEVNSSLEELFSKPGTTNFSFDSLRYYFKFSNWFYNKFRFITLNIGSPAQPGILVQCKANEDSAYAVHLNFELNTIKSIQQLSSKEEPLYLIIEKADSGASHFTEAFVVTISEDEIRLIDDAFNGIDELKALEDATGKDAICYNPQTAILTIKHFGELNPGDENNGVEEMKFNGQWFEPIEK